MVFTEKSTNFFYLYNNSYKILFLSLYIEIQQDEYSSN